MNTNTNKLSKKNYFLGKLPPIEEELSINSKPGKVLDLGSRLLDAVRQKTSQNKFIKRELDLGPRLLQAAIQQNLRNNWPNTTGQLDFDNFDYTPVLQNPYAAIAKSAPMMYGVYPALAVLAARSLYNNYYASGGKTKKRSQRKRQTKKRL
jgi:hypothetical protein